MSAASRYARSMAVHALIFRPPREEDWPQIWQLATDAVVHVEDAPSQDEWLRNRLGFQGERVHFVAERAEEVIGYAAVERRAEEPDATFRIFVVVPWATQLDVAEALYERAAAELTGLGARRAWLREYASDEPLISFVRRKGFEVTEQYLLEGRKLVTLAKNLGGGSLTV